MTPMPTWVQFFLQFRRPDQIIQTNRSMIVVHRLFGRVFIIEEEI